MTHKQHSVLVVESEPRIKRILDKWLHEIEAGIEVDQVETTLEAKERIRERELDGYDLVISDEYLPGTDTGTELFRYCATEHPEIPFLMTADKYLNAYITYEYPQEVHMNVLDPEDPAEGLPLIKRLLEQRRVRQLQMRRDDLRSLWAGALLMAGLVAITPILKGTVASILQNPPFTDRFIIEPAVPQTQPLEELLAPPPPRPQKNSWDIPFDVQAMFIPVKAEMAKILARADEILAMTKTE
jgi:CheY-like chemotaxis protein